MRLLVTGGRNFTDRAMVDHVLSRIHAETPISVLIEGEAPGADTLARLWAEANGVQVIRRPAQWKKYGRAAGPIRNKQMLADCPDRVVAFPGGPGTQNMVDQATAAGIRVDFAVDLKP